MPQTLTLAAAAGAMLATFGSALGASEFGIIAQNRQAVTGAVVINAATGQIDNDEQLAEPFGPGPWQASIDSTAQLGNIIAVGGAIQDSIISPTGLSGTGTATAALTSTSPDTASQAFALSAFAAFFAINSPTLVTFSAAISDTSSSFMIFEGPGGIIAELSAGAGPDLSIDLTVLLAPGNYALNASSGLDFSLPADTPGVGINASWSLDLAIVPSPAAPALAMIAGLFATRRRR